MHMETQPSAEQTDKETLLTFDKNSYACHPVNVGFSYLDKNETGGKNRKEGKSSVLKHGSYCLHIGMET